VGGLQLRGATEWMNPEHLSSGGVVSAAPPARTSSRPHGRVSPGVTRRPAPFDRGDPLRAVMPKFLSAILNFSAAVAGGNFAYVCDRRFDDDRIVIRVDEHRNTGGPRKKLSQQPEPL
jgi:hypothetical protein